MGGAGGRRAKNALKMLQKKEDKTYNTETGLWENPSRVETLDEALGFRKEFKEKADCEEEKIEQLAALPAQKNSRSSSSPPAGEAVDG